MGHTPLFESRTACTSTFYQWCLRFYVLDANDVASYSVAKMLWLKLDTLRTSHDKTTWITQLQAHMPNLHATKNDTLSSRAMIKRKRDVQSHALVKLHQCLDEQVTSFRFLVWWTPPSSTSQFANVTSIHIARLIHFWNTLPHGTLLTDFTSHMSLVNTSPWQLLQVFLTHCDVPLATVWCRALMIKFLSDPTASACLLSSTPLPQFEDAPLHEDCKLILQHSARVQSQAPDTCSTLVCELAYEYIASRIAQYHMHPRFFITVYMCLYSSHPVLSNVLKWTHADWRMVEYQSVVYNNVYARLNSFYLTYPNMWRAWHYFIQEGFFAPSFQSLPRTQQQRLTKLSRLSHPAWYQVVQRTRAWVVTQHKHTGGTKQNNKRQQYNVCI